MLEVLASAVGGSDPRATARRRGLLGWLDRVAEPRERNLIEGEATAALERNLGGDVWIAVVAVWNACCVALLSDRLDTRLRSGLEASWQRANVGPTPLAQLVPDVGRPVT